MVYDHQRLSSYYKKTDIPTTNYNVSVSSFHQESLDRNIESQLIQDRHQPTFCDNLMMYHQNICGLRGKIDDVISHLYPNFPHILYFLEHHLNKIVMDQIKLNNYEIGAHCCRQSVGRGGVCIFIHESLRCSHINLYNLCSDKDER
jgi:hypothetical protein